MSIISSLKQVLNGQNYTKYSTDEQVIGTWIDGKPIYQKTFTGTLANVNYTFIPNAPSVIDNIISVGGTLYSPNQPSEQSIQIGAYLNSDYYSGFYGDFSLWYSNTYKNGSYYLTVQYTKITD